MINQEAQIKQCLTELEVLITTSIYVLIRCCPLLDNSIHYMLGEAGVLRGGSERLGGRRLRGWEGGS